MYDKLEAEHLLDCCDKIALRSPDPSTKVGAILVSGLQEVVAYNSFPSTLTFDDSDYEDRPRKYDRIIHAEMRCLLLAGMTLSHGSYLFTSCPPCKDCAKHIIEARVKEVWFRHDRFQLDFVKRNHDNVQTALRLFAASKIRVWTL